MHTEFLARVPPRAAVVVALLLAFVLPLVAAWPTPAQAGPVNVNAADAATLARELQGIGPSKAQAIVAHRDKHGPFRSAEDLARVRGIGRKTVDRNKDLLRFDGRATAAASTAAAPAKPPAPGTKSVPGGR
jgi:competence protein ComEA